MRRFMLAVVVASLAACGGGPSGTLTGLVVVQGGSAAGVAVTAIGPTSGGGVTGSDGAYSISALANGAYVVSAIVPGSAEGEQRVAVKVDNNKGVAPDLKFTVAAGTGSVTGKVEFSDAGDATGVPVVLVGPVSRAAATGADGAFGFDGLPAGSYVLTAQAAETREKSLAVAVTVAAGQATAVPPLSFTAVASVSGKATKGSVKGNAGILVAIAGTALTAVTGDDGAYFIDEVPADSQVVIATATGYDPATVAVTVARGPNAVPSLTLLPAKQPTGNVNGSVIILEHFDSSIITVSADGTAFSVPAKADGTYALPLPTGHWDIVASAPNYPKQLLARVEVSAGGNVSLPLAVLTPWQTIALDPVVTTTELHLASDGDHAIYSQQFGTAWAYFMVDLRAGTLRMFFSNTAATPVSFAVSRHGKWVAWPTNAGWQILELATSQAKYLTVASNTFAGALPTFSSDEAYFLVADGAQIHRVDLATGADAPITGVSWQSVATDKWMVRDVAAVPYTLSLIGPSGAATVAASSVTAMTQLTWVQYSGQVLALTNCVGTCTLRVIDPLTGAAKTATGAYPAAALVGIYSTRSPDWVIVGNQWFLKLTDASTTVLPAGFLLGNNAYFDVSPDGTKIAYNTGVAPPYSLVQEAMPPAGGGAALKTSTAQFRVSWLSDKRWMALDLAVPPHRYESVNGAALTTDADLTATQAVCLLASDYVPVKPVPACAWRRASDKKMVFASRDFPDYSIDLGANPQIFGLAESPDGKWAVYSGLDSDLGEFTAVRDTANPATLKVYPGTASCQVNNTVGELSTIAIAGQTAQGGGTGIELLVLDTGQRIPLRADGVSLTIGASTLGIKSEATGKRQIVGARTTATGALAWAWMTLP